MLHFKFIDTFKVIKKTIIITDVILESERTYIIIYDTKKNKFAYKGISTQYLDYYRSKRHQKTYEKRKELVKKIARNIYFNGYFIYKDIITDYIDFNEKERLKEISYLVI